METVVQHQATHQLAQGLVFVSLILMGFLRCVRLADRYRETENRGSDDLELLVSS